MPIVETVTLGTAILNAIKGLLGLKESLVKADSAKRAEMADLFEKVAVCLEQAAAEIRAGVYPANRCHEMLTYAVALPARMKGVVPDGEANEISLALKEAHQVERLFGLSDKPEGTEQLRALDEAAGTIRGLGNLLRV